MGMGPLSIQSGYEESFYAALETTFGTFKKPAASDAINIKSSSITPNQERVNRMDKRASRSISERITRKKSADWTMNTYLNPSGTAGTAPDIGGLLEAGFGTATPTPATKVDYTLAKDINKSFTITRKVGTWSEAAIGCIVNQAIFRVKGEDECEVEISGLAANFIHTAPTTLAASSASGSDELTITDPTLQLSVGSVIQVGTDTNGGAGFQVTTIVGTTVTLESGLTADAASAAAVVAYAPTPVTAGSPASCISGSLTIDGSTYYITEFEITLNNNLNMQNDFFGFETAQGYSASSHREVTFSGTCYVQNEHSKIRGESVLFSSMPVVLTIGSVAGKKVVLTMSEAEFNIVPMEIPEAEQATFTLEGSALDASAGEGELTCSFQ